MDSEKLLQYHKNPISLREGKVFLDGYEIFDAVKCEIKFTPEVWTGKQIRHYRKYYKTAYYCLDKGFGSGLYQYRCNTGAYYSGDCR